MKRRVEAAQSAMAESQSGDKAVQQRLPGFRFGAFMGGLMQGAAHAANRASRAGEAREESERTSDASRPSDTVMPPEVINIPAVYPVRLCQ